MSILGSSPESGIYARARIGTSEAPRRCKMSRRPLRKDPSPRRSLPLALPELELLVDSFDKGDGEAAGYENRQARATRCG